MVTRLTHIPSFTPWKENINKLFINYINRRILFMMMMMMMNDDASEWQLNCMNFKLTINKSILSNLHAFMEASVQHTFSCVTDHARSVAYVISAVITRETWGTSINRKSKNLIWTMNQPKVSPIAQVQSYLDFLVLSQNGIHSEWDFGWTHPVKNKLNLF